MSDFWNEKYELMDYLLDTNLTLKEIADDLQISTNELSKRIKQMGLEWIRRSNRKVSRGQSSLTSIVKKLIPNEKIVNEHHIGDKLRLDVYCPAYNLAFEYHGRQHFYHVPHFHEKYEDFVRAQENDRLKEEKCRQQGITLVVFKYNDNLSEEIVRGRILDALRDQSDVDVKVVAKKSVKDNPIYQEMKAKRKEYNKNLRAAAKKQSPYMEY